MNLTPPVWEGHAKLDSLLERKKNSFIPVNSWTQTNAATLFIGNCSQQVPLASDSLHELLKSADNNIQTNDTRTQRSCLPKHLIFVNLAVSFGASTGLLLRLDGIWWQLGWVAANMQILVVSKIKSFICIGTIWKAESKGSQIKRLSEEKLFLESCNKQVGGANCQYYTCMPPSQIWKI